MKQIDHTEWELLKKHSATHLEDRFWQSGTFCVVSGAPGHPARIPEIWVPQPAASPLHLMH